MLSSLAVGQNTLPMNVDTVFAKKNLKVGRSLFLMDTSYRKSGKVLSVDSLTGRVILVNNSAASSNVDSSKWERVNNKLQPKNTTDSVLLHKKLILDDYKNQTIEVPEYQTKIATTLSYNNIFNEIVAVQACDASGFTTLPTINTINGSMYNFSPTTCGLGADVWELSLNFPVNYTSCPGAYVDEIKVRTVGVSNGGGGYGTCLKVDGIGAEYDGEPIYSDDNDNAPFDYYFIDTTNRTSLSSIIATFLWAGEADLGLDGMEVILKIGGCENKYIVLSTDANGLVKLDTLPDFITADEIPTVSSTNIYNSDGVLTDDRYLDGNGYNLTFGNTIRIEQNVTNNSGNTNNYSRNPGFTQEIIDDINNNGNYNRLTYPTQDDINMYDNVNTSRKNQNPSQINFTVRDLANTKVNQSLFSREQSNFQVSDDQGNVGTTNLGSNNFEVTMQDAAINTTGIILTPTTVKIKTNSNPSTATTGQVLTLIDQNTGECDWADAGSGGNNNYSLTAGNGLQKINDSTLAISDINNGGSYLTQNISLSGGLNDNSIYLSGYGNLSGNEAMIIQGFNSSISDAATSVVGNNGGSGEDIEIIPNTGKLAIKNLNTDNTSTQVMGKDANGYSVWVDKSSIAGSNIYNSGGTLTSPRVIYLEDKPIEFFGSGLGSSFTAITNSSVSTAINLQGSSTHNAGISIDGYSGGSQNYSYGTTIKGASNAAVGVFIDGRTATDIYKPAIHIKGQSISSTMPNIVIEPVDGNKLVQIYTVAGLVMPVGNTAKRPTLLLQGTQRFNSTILGLEVYDGTNWIILSGTWSTGTRPTGIGAGSTGFNTTLSQKEYWNGTTWIQF